MIGTLPPGKGYSSGALSTAASIFSVGLAAAATGSPAASPTMIIEGPSFAVIASGVTKYDAEAAPVVRSVAKANPAIIRVKKNGSAQITA
ncbi:MAG: hypothetical protein ACTHLP_09750 [Rhizobiaceae bacterium]